MKDVAAFKWQHGLPIENLEREKIVLASAIQQGLHFQLTKDSSQAFFEVQIDAAKEIQGYWFEQWRKKPGSIPQSSVDLDGEIRPALILLGQSITAELAMGSPGLASLTIEGLSSATVARLGDVARTVEVYPDRLTQVLDTGVLRVGTTGDYAPFSYRGEQNSSASQWSGIDIDLAQDLALSLGVKIQWVHTSWPELMNDLHSGRYDIGMSGISISQQRKKTAYFSTPYHSGGKTPLIRCSDDQKYSSLAAIDKPQTRLVVNPGGTNQKFVNLNIHKAKVLVHNDNRSIFNELIMNRADVMITDQIEVRLRSGLHSELCAAMGNQTLTFSEKAFLLPQDKTWRDTINGWLKQRLDDGLVDKLFDLHLSSRGSN